jgi:branched-chain amino acid transport system ATP-binding protein
MLTVKQLDLTFGKNRVLKSVDLDAGAGEIVALIGPNAAGKTCTLRSLLGLHAAKGAVSLNGQDLSAKATHERVREGLVLVPEGRQVFPRSTVLDNLLMGAYHRQDRNSCQTDIDRVVELFPRLGERTSQKAGSMSGGEQQMLAIARGLMSRPKCLLLDEPTLGLAPVIVNELLGALKLLAAEGLTILLAEQNATAALSTANRAYLLERGTISISGRVDDLQNDDRIREMYLGH